MMSRNAVAMRAAREGFLSLIFTPFARIMGDALWPATRRAERAEKQISISTRRGPVHSSGWLSGSSLRPYFATGNALVASRANSAIRFIESS